MTEEKFEAANQITAKIRNIEMILRTPEDNDIALLAACNQFNFSREEIHVFAYNLRQSLEKLKADYEKEFESL